MRKLLLPNWNQRTQALCQTIIHSDSSTKSIWVFEGYNNSCSYHLRALDCISWLRGVGTFGSWGVLKAVRFSIARDSCKPKPSNPSLSKPGSSHWKQPLKLPAPVAYTTYQLANLGNQETFSNRQCQQRGLNGEERRASTPEHRFSRMTDVKLLPTCAFLGELEPAALSVF